MDVHVSEAVANMGNDTLKALKGLAGILGVTKFKASHRAKAIQVPSRVPTNSASPRVPVRNRGRQSDVVTHRYPLRSLGHIPAHQLNEVIDDKSGRKLEYKHLVGAEDTRDVWMQSFARELGRLAQGWGKQVQGTDSIVFALMGRFQRKGGRI